MQDLQDLYPPTPDMTRRAHLKREEFDALYKQSVEDPNGFWKDMAQRIDWFKKPTKIKNTSFKKPVSIKWYEDGTLNACYNCVDRHLPEKIASTALIWEGNDPNESKKITYGELKEEVCKLANALKSRGVKKGDRVTIYMPMVPEAVYAMLACARIGAVHSVVFGGFSPEALKNRILDCRSNIVITADQGRRGNKLIPLKENVDEAVRNCINVDTVLVLKCTGNDINWNEETDIWWHDLVDIQEPECPCEEMNAEDPLFILYTSGSTGAPKGVLHTTGGYMVYTSLTHEYVFDYHPGEVYWCTADVGWITGHSYIVYGPLANGAISLIYEGVPSYPDASRFWQVVDKHKVNIFYTAPTALRALIAGGDEFVKKTSRKSLRVLGTVGEPINKEAWHWYYEVVGDKRCAIIDTWWQTETGGHMITPLVSFDLKPGSASLPFLGIKPLLVDREGQVLKGETEGLLCIADSWPGQMRTVYGDHQRFEDTYFKHFPGLYETGDGARRDADGYYWITGRVDDVINVSGHRIGTAEVEDAIDTCKKVAESAVVGVPHEIKGQGIYAYVTLMKGCEESDELRKEIIQTVRKVIGPVASPDTIQFAKALPKTRSGKIMRRILRKIAAYEEEHLGDISTLAEPDVVTALIKGRVPKE
ncbi:MAG: acetate--CoA ligase [Alphaproteobacteria bacterium]|nr:acetate--CoA ligase [Alphaproteobacteria bacterium]